MQPFVLEITSFRTQWAPVWAFPGSRRVGLYSRGNRLRFRLPLAS